MQEMREAGGRNGEQQQAEDKGQRKVENSESQQALDQCGAGALGPTSALAGGACTFHKMTQMQQNPTHKGCFGLPRSIWKPQNLQQAVSKTDGFVANHIYFQLFCYYCVTGPLSLV